MTAETIQRRLLPVAGALLLAVAMFLLAWSTPAPAGAATATVSKGKQAKKTAREKARERARKRREARKRAAKRRAAARLRKRIAGLKFYTPPKTLPKGHGKLIWQRKADGLVPLKSASSTKLVLYTSVSPTGKRIAVSGSVSFPKGKAPKGGWPVITYGHGTTGIADICAPSRNKAGGPAVGYINYTDQDQNMWLDAGYAVARTDYEGLGVPKLTHPFLVGESEGRGVLDIVRAAREMGPKVSKNFLIAGHSQGGQAALFAGGLAASWVPDLKLKGTVAYAPASNFKLQATLLGSMTEPSGLSGLASMLIVGQSVVDPSVKPAEIMSDSFVPFLPQVTTKCLPQLAEPTSLGGLAPSTLLRNTNLTDPVNVNLLNVLEKQNPELKSVAPILLLQGDADTTTLPFLSVKLKTQLEAKGNDLTYLTYPTADHGTVLVDARPDVMAFFRSKLPSGR
ncbi:MAG: prolyl oligopeptidase family serine peptidase [Solirubrobacterales bacterium]|nr:prolyl oligopeptidase family serine peptidase [Solirubrobacterales bacterium]